MGVFKQYTEITVGNYQSVFNDVMLCIKDEDLSDEENYVKYGRYANELIMDHINEKINNLRRAKRRVVLAIKDYRAEI